MNDGIATKINLRCAAFTGFQRKRALIFRCGLSRTGNCQPDSSVSLPVSSLPTGWKRPFHKGSARRSTIEWGSLTVDYVICDVCYPVHRHGVFSALAAFRKGR